MKKAQQVWLEIDVMDYINKECKWAEVGIKEHLHTMYTYRSVSRWDYLKITRCTLPVVQMHIFTMESDF